MKRDKKHVDDSKPVYEAPNVMKLDGQQSSFGDCGPGSNDLNDCSPNGNNATQGCFFTGASAGLTCQGDGSDADTTCTANGSSVG